MGQEERRLHRCKKGAKNRENIDTTTKRRHARCRGWHNTAQPNLSATTTISEQPRQAWRGEPSMPSKDLISWGNIITDTSVLPMLPNRITSSRRAASRTYQEKNQSCLLKVSLKTVTKYTNVHHKHSRRHRSAETTHNTNVPPKVVERHPGAESTQWHRCAAATDEEPHTSVL